MCEHNLLPVIEGRAQRTPGWAEAQVALDSEDFLAGTLSGACSASSLPHAHRMLSAQLKLL